MRTIPPTDPGFLPEQYEQNGLLAKIVDMPAEDAAYCGFTLEGISLPARSYLMRQLDRLEWTTAAATGLKWQRLFGGALAVIFADDGRGLEQPLDLERVRAADGIQVFDSSTVQAELDAEGEPVRFSLLSKRARCTVHASRCLVFKSDPLPERSTDPAVEFWGAPLYPRIQKALQNVLVSHGYAVKILERAGGSVLKTPGLSEFLSTELGEEKALERLRALEMLRGLFSTLYIDASEEFQYFAQAETMTRIKSLINGTWLELSSVTGIPADYLVGEHIPFTEGEMIGTWKTSSPHESRRLYADLIQSIQEKSLKAPLLRLLEIIGRAGVAAGELRTVEPVLLKWRPIYQARGVEAADNKLKRAQIQRIRAETLAGQVAGAIITPAEVRRTIKGRKM